MFALTPGLTTASITLLDIAAPSAGRLGELAVLMGWNALATVVRFVLLRSWMGRFPEPDPG